MQHTIALLYLLCVRLLRRLKALLVIVYRHNTGTLVSLQEPDLFQAFAVWSHVAGEVRRSLLFAVDDLGWVLDVLDALAAVGGESVGLVVGRCDIWQRLGVCEWCFLDSLLWARLAERLCH